MERPGQVDEERCPLAFFALGADRSTVAFHDSSTDREADPGAFVARAPMQALEYGEDLLGVVLLETNTCVTNRDEPAGANEDCFYPDFQVSVVGSELQCVAEQVL